MLTPECVLIDGDARSRMGSLAEVFSRHAEVGLAGPETYGRGVDDSRIGLQVQEVLRPVLAAEDATE